MVSPEYRQNGSVPQGEVLNTYATFLYPDGLVVLDAYATTHGFMLPGEQTSQAEFDALRHAIASGELPLSLFPDPQLPSLKQLSRISIKAVTGCWELPIYMNGEDVYPDSSAYAGRPRARYGNLSVNGIRQQGKATAHRTMYAVFRGDVPRGKWLDHICNNKQCCWPRHLEAVMPGENTKRGREYNVLAAGQMRLFNPPRPVTA